MEKDLLIIDGEVEIKTKRKSLKTLRKMRAISEAKADGAVSEDEKDVGFRGLRKLWDGIPTNKLSLLGLNVVLGEPVGDGDGGEENGENDDVTVQDDGTIPTDAAVNNMTEKQLKYWIITKFNKKTKSKTAKDLKNELLKLLPNERVAWEAASEEREALKQAALEEAEAKLNELSESYESFRTHGHSCVIKGRLNAFSLMQKEFNLVVNESDKGMDHMLDDLIRKEKAWNEQVEKVVQTCLK